MRVRGRLWNMLTPFARGIPQGASWRSSPSRANHSDLLDIPRAGETQQTVVQVAFAGIWRSRAAVVLQAR